MRNHIIYGKQGSGKTTYANRIIAKYGSKIKEVLVVYSPATFLYMYDELSKYDENNHLKKWMIFIDEIKDIDALKKIITYIESKRTGANYILCLQKDLTVLELMELRKHVCKESREDFDITQTTISSQFITKTTNLKTMDFI